MEIFGEFIRARREAASKSLRGLARDVGIAPAYMLDIERGNRPAPFKYLDRLIECLELKGADVDRLYDLAGITHDSVPPDLVSYLSGNPLARAALRLARDRKITAERWQEFIDDIS